MKPKISGITCPGMVMLLLVGLFSLAAPASADFASWSAESTPSTMDNVLGPDGVDVRDIAVAADGKIIYAVPGDSVSDNVIYKSTDTGVSWSTLDVSIEADMVAIAPDDSALVAIANSSPPQVYLTGNGGSNWSNLDTPQESGGTPAAAIYDIAISAASDGIHYITVPGKEAGDIANVWYYDTGTAVPAWQETKGLPGFSSASEVKSIAFSPNFTSDETMVAISAKNGTSVNLQMLSLNSERWNNNAGFSSFPATIFNNSGITELTSASISLAPDYMGDEHDKRVVFVGLTVNGNASAVATSGIYRLENATVKALGTELNIHSIAYDGTSLIAGVYSGTTVYRSTDPLATTPTISLTSDLKTPGGDSRVVVIWAGNKLLAGTSGNESAFAISRNNGASFNDISLIDTAITSARDVAVSSDGNKVYWVTDDGDDLSLWRQASSWERVLSQPVTTNYIVRLAPDDSDVIYLAQQGDTTIYYSKSGGETEWFPRTCRVNIQDLAVESADVAYALNSDGKVSKSSDAGFIWSSVISTELNSGATIVSVSQDTLLVGSQDGYVAYSSDGNASWTEIDEEVLQSGVGKVQVIADTNYATNKIIYAASDTAEQHIMKWQIGTSTEWTDISRSIVRGGIYGLTMNDDTLYALEFNSSTGQSALWQCPSPATYPSIFPDWSSSTTTASTDADDAVVHLNATPRALKTSSGKLWAVKTNGTNKLYSFTDILIEVTQLTPAPGFLNPVSPINGIAHDIYFTWERPPKDTKHDYGIEFEYELQIGYDSDFDTPITTITVESISSSVVTVIGPYQTGATKFNFTPGETYYWRVRTTQPLYGQYSVIRSFSIEPMIVQFPRLLAPPNGSASVSRTPAFSWEPISGATEYQFVLSEESTMAFPIVDRRVKNSGFALTEELDYGKTYFWKIRAVEPVEGNWSALANFTVTEKPTEAVPPVTVQQTPPPLINVPVPPAAPDIVTSPPSPVPPPAIPPYLRAAIIIGVILILAVIVLIARPFRAAEGFPGARVRKLGEGLATYSKALRTFKIPKASSSKENLGEASQPISFAAESFLWMMSSGKENGGDHLLSADEEQALGKILATRIQGIAKEQLLYQKFPKDAALFLYLWSHYGSRDETNSYLTKSFQSRPENVIDFLKCYLTSNWELEPNLPHQGVFRRAQYDSLTKVIDPDNVFETLKRLYGPELDTPEGAETGDFLDKAITYQFAHIHQLARSETKTRGKVLKKRG